MSTYAKQVSLPDGQAFRHRGVRYLSWTLETLGYGASDRYEDLNRIGQGRWRHDLYVNGDLVEYRVIPWWRALALRLALGAYPWPQLPLGIDDPEFRR